MRESKKKKIERMNAILSVLQKQYPDAICALLYSTPFQLLIATILSAQCTDARVNIVTPHLFAEYPDAESLQHADINHLEEIIHSTGFYKAKAKNILACSKMIMNVYNGELPLDTHVTRIMNALRFVKTTDAVKIEQELLPLIPQHDWTVFTHRIIEHGRAVCIARRPKCNDCVISEYCPSASILLK